MKNFSLPVVFAVAIGCGVPENALSAPPQNPASRWVAIPSAEDFARNYPETASRAEVGGRAVLNCTLNSVGVPTDCAVAQEDPQGFGFGAAALKLSKLFRASSTYNGKPTAGTTVRIPITFRAPE